MPEICYQCFREKGTAGPCPHCGADDTGQGERYPLALKPSTMLSARYLMGLVKARDSLGFTYIALDERTRRRVEIREYCPSYVHERQEGACAVLVPPEKEAEFEKGKSCFLSEWRTLAGLGENGRTARIQDAFEDNGTAYAVTEHVAGLSLKVFMGRLGRCLSVEEAERLLMPLVETVEKMNAAGIVHRGISSESVIITRDGTARLVGFGTAGVLAGQKGMEGAARFGFAPIEQYSAADEQGPWTDVYSMAAVFYYVITGKVPPGAEERREEDRLAEPGALVSGLDAQTEAVLLKALRVRAPDRFRNMGEFRAALCGELPVELPAVKPTAPAPQKPVRRRRRKLRALLALIVLALLVSIVGLVGGDRIAMDYISELRSGETAAHETPEPTPRPTAEPTPVPTPEPLKITALAAGEDFTAAVRSDGRVVATGSNSFGQCDVSAWKGVSAIAVGAGTVSDTGLSEHLVGLRKNGTLYAAGNNDFGQCDVLEWRDITAVSAGWAHTLGLRKDGTVLAVGNNSNGQCRVSDWKNITAIAAGEYHSAGLRADGTVVAVGFNGDGQCSVESWTDIVAIAAGRWHTVGLKADGTVLAAGKNENGCCNVSEWTDIVAVSVGRWHTLGLRSDGTVLAAGRNNSGCCDVSGWHDITAIAAGWDHSVGLCSDGTLVMAGDSSGARCDIEALTAA